MQVLESPIVLKQIDSMATLAALASLSNDGSEAAQAELSREIRFVAHSLSEDLGKVDEVLYREMVRRAGTVVCKVAHA